MRFTYHDILNFEAEFGEDFVSDDGPGGELFITHDAFRRFVVEELFDKDNSIMNIGDIDDLFIEVEDHFPEDDINELINKAFIAGIDEYSLGTYVHNKIGEIYD